MEKKIFNPSEWLQQKETEKTSIAISPNNKEVKDEVEHIIQQIEEKQIDITSAYCSWRDIGFALAQSFGEEGREFFHRVSRFHPDYTTTGCDSQFNNCCSFWDRLPFVDSLGLDGSEWTIEAHFKNKYWFVNRWSPDDNFRIAGEYLITKSGINKERIY